MIGGLNTGTQYDEFISKDNFILAYKRLKTVKRNEYKEFFYKDFECFKLFFEKIFISLLLISVSIYINLKTVKNIICQRKKI